MLNVVICGFIHFKFNFETDNLGQQVQTYTALTVLIVFITIPWLLLAYLTYYFNSLESKVFLAKIGAFYNALKIKNGRKVLLNPVAFIVRRIWLSYLIVYSQSILITQMAQVFVMTLFVVLTDY